MYFISYEAGLRDGTCQRARARLTTLMKLPRLFLLLFLLSATALRADLTIVQKMDGKEGSHTVTMKIKGEMARVEITPKLTTLIDAKTGELTMLMNDEKQVMRISGERAKQMADMAKAMAKDTTAGVPAAPKATGKKQTINGFETEEYVSDAPKVHTSYWVAKNYPGGDAIMKQMAVLQSGAFAAMRQGMPDFKDLPGVPIRTEVKVKGDLQMTSTMQSVNQDPIPAAEFAPPADYSEMKIPAILSGEKTPGDSGQ